jgi:uncharacterized glyoxalase superfamily protein PhnB
VDRAIPKETERKKDMATKVKAIPDGYTSVTPHLSLNDAAKAIAFYKKAFGAEEVFRMPMPDGKVGHAELKIGNAMVMLADECPQYEGAKAPQSLKGSTVGLHLYVENVDAAFKKAVDAGARAVMPPMDMFWGDRFCKIADPFGHYWSIATHTKDLTPQQIEEGMKAAFSQKACG